MENAVNSRIKKDCLGNEIDRGYNNALNNDQTMDVVRHKLELFQAIILKDVQKHVKNCLDEVMQELRQQHVQSQEFANFAQAEHQQKTGIWTNRQMGTIAAATTNTSKENPVVDHNNKDKQHIQETINNVGKTIRHLPDKIFTTRESYLTALLKVDHMKTIYHIFYAIFTVFLLNTIVQDYLAKGSFKIGSDTFRTSFAKIQYVLLVWLLQHVFVFGIYYACRLWASWREILQPQSFTGKLWSCACLTLYALSQFSFLIIACFLNFKLDLPFASGIVLQLETIRLLMKMHAFVRTNIPRVLHGKVKTDDQLTQHAIAIAFPSFSWYLYFLFAPTLVYRDFYPRSSRIRWKFALSRFMEVVAIAFLYSYICECYIVPNFSDFGKHSFNISFITVKLFASLMPFTMILLTGFYMILHAWHNFTAELLRFGDRMFYKDWWTASNYDTYYRKWNVIVHDWLYEYIYKDFYIYVFKGSKFLSSLVVFWISALFHDIPLCFSLHLFFPAICIFLGLLGVLLVFITRLAPKNFGNFALWFSLIVGNGALVAAYCTEYYARFNCPKLIENWWNHLLPHMWYCYHNNNI
ncbi:sterol O-acyltransferase 1 [Glossina fuscipes]|uniref:O-acyltransferase n=1 Tax=Glossina fuscipes TaxID=7396 RepID=A0A9C6DXW3_9MUSC|nr:sterol O-acyltransferase 1 [Glossina fuscipes]